ncbi:MAG: cation:proton antiporter domain-containing protein [Gammaproteobacteria bacterium]
MIFNPVLLSLVVLLAVAVTLSAVFRRLTLPLIPAYVLAGILLGPHGLAWLADTADVRTFAHWGVILLLFTLGLEFSPTRLREIRKNSLILSLALIGVQAGLGCILIRILGWSWPLAVFLGFVLSLSSTVLVARQLSEQNELALPHGRLTLALSLLQDLLAVPLFMLAPVWLGHHGIGESWGTFAGVLARGTLVVVFLWIVGRGVVDRLFREVAKRKAAELFTLSVLLVTVTAAMVTQSIGMSAVLGAFLAGMILGGTEFRHQVEADIRPFRDVLLGLFFVSIGMLFNPTVLIQYGGLVAVGIAIVLTIKILTTAGVSRMMGRDRETAWRAAFVLSPVGEFGLALMAFVPLSVWPDRNDGEVVLGIIIGSLLVGTFLIRFNLSLFRWLHVRSAPAGEQLSEVFAPPVPAAFRDQVILCGYGRVGQNLARFLEQNGIPFVALDLDLARVRAAHQAGDPVYYGDATDLSLLEGVGLMYARALVIAYQDVQVSMEILSRVRPVRADIPILVRTLDDMHLAELQRLGATEVIPETLEASLMLAATLLHVLGVPLSRIFHQIQRVRAARYSLLRSVFRSGEAPVRSTVHAFREELRNIILSPDAAAIGQTLEEMALSELGCVITALRREGIVGKQPAPGTELRPGDTLVLYGTPEDLDRAETRLIEGVRPVPSTMPG